MKYANDHSQAFGQIVQESSQKSNRRSPIGWVVLLVLVVLPLTALLIYRQNLSRAYSTLVHETHVQEDPSQREERIKKKEPLTVLLVATNYQQKGRLGNKEAPVIQSMILSPQQEKMIQVTLDPQILARTFGEGQEQPLDMHYTKNGLASVVDAVETTYGLSVDFVYEFDLSEIRPFLDEVGSLNVTSPEALSFSDFSLAEGEKRSLSPRQVEEFLLPTDSDDHTYYERQQEVLQQLIHHLLDRRRLLSLPDKLESTQSLLVTDLSWSKLSQMFWKGYWRCFSLVEQMDARQVGEREHDDPDKIQAFKDELTRRLTNTEGVKD